MYYEKRLITKSNFIFPHDIHLKDLGRVFFYLKILLLLTDHVFVKNR